MTQQSGWAARLADVVAHQLHDVPEAGSSLFVHSINVRPDETVEVIYSTGMDPALKGIRLDADSVRSGGELLRTSSVDELAFFLVHVGLCEPRPNDDFLPPDHQGVRWLPMREWWHAWDD